MNRRLVIRAAMVVGFLGLCVGGWLGTRQQGIDAMGGSWTPQDVSWSEADGATRGALTWAPKRVRIARGADGRELLVSLCNATLSHLDDLGAGAVDPSAIYRLDLMILTEEGAPLFGDWVPYPVRAGQCAPELFPDGVIFPTYADPISGWYLAGGGAESDGNGGSRPAMIFQPLPGADPSVPDFDAAAACAAVLDDPRAWNEVTGPRADATRLHIRALSAGNGTAQSLGTYQAEDFVISDDQCLQGAEG